MRSPLAVPLVLAVAALASDRTPVRRAEPLLLRAFPVTSQGEVVRAEQGSDGAFDTSGGLAVRGPKGVALSFVIYGFQSAATRAWTLHVDCDAAAQGAAQAVAYHVEVSTDGGRTYQSMRNEGAPLKRSDFAFDLGVLAAAQVRARVTLYLRKDTAASGAMNVWEVYLKEIPATRLELRSQAVSFQGEVSRPNEATDGAPDTAAGLAVRGPDGELLSQVLLGFASGDAREWALHVDLEATAHGEGQVLYHLEMSTDAGRTFRTLQQGRAQLKRAELTFPAGIVPASSVRVRVTLYLQKKAPAAGAMNLYEVYLAG